MTSSGAPDRGSTTMTQSERARAETAYYAAHGLTRPSHNVMRLAGRAIRERAERHLGGRMLDVGCGTKAKAALVGDLIAEHVGLDHEDCPHDRSRIDLFGSADAIPVPDGSFDCVLSTAVLEHLEEPQAAVRESYRVLRPGGCALYTAPLFWHIHEAPRDFFRYTEFGLRHLFERAGFEVVEITPLAGFWITAAAQAGYYAQRFRIGILRPVVDAFVAFANLIARWLDRGWLRDERFTWMYIVVARRPARPAGEERA